MIVMSKVKKYPVRKPYKKGYFDVGEGHKLFYRLYGNPKGIPLLYVHGGPGAGCGEKAYRIFNPKKYNILLLDQRGAGKSKPFASTKNNTTKRLVEDMRKFLDFLGIKKTFLIGGSWGSYLGLCFAIKYPERVKGMVLRGIFLGSREEDDFLFKGGVKTHFPDIWEKFVNLVPKKQRNYPAKFYLKKLLSKNMKTVRKYAKAWADYELSLLSITGKKVKLGGNRYIPFARMEAFYLVNDCFMPKGYILKNVDKIKNIPFTIVHGRFDFVTMPASAIKLHKVLPKSKLILTVAGHASSDTENVIEMVKALNRMA